MRSFRLGAATVGFLVTATFTGLSFANAPQGQYATNAGTVYDSKTKLTWQQTAPSGTYTVANAVAYCAGLGATLTGSWRLPTVKELNSLVDYSRSTAPLIDSLAFGGTPSARFWSATASAGSTTSGWYVSFVDGTAGGAATSTTYNVRCVR